MHTTGRNRTNAQSHTLAVVVFQRTTRPARTKVPVRGARDEIGISKCEQQSTLTTRERNDTSSLEVMKMINKKLRELRQRAGIPLEILAYKARVSPRTLWRWERWGCTPRSWESIQRVADVLKVAPEDLLDDEEDQG